MTRPCDEQEFLKSVSEHAMEILRDDHVYRHLRFRRPGTYCMGFDIITYPGYLCYSGDMGCFVFSRIHDMLSFFRSKKDGALEINPHYWSEKLQAVETNVGACQEYSADKFRAHIADELQHFRERIAEDTDPIYDENDNEDESATQKKISDVFNQLNDAITLEVLSKADDGEYAIYQAMRDFEHDKRHWFRDSWEVSFREYSYRFLWCCFALVWSIRKYDAAKTAVNEVQATG